MKRFCVPLVLLVVGLCVVTETSFAQRSKGRATASTASTGTPESLPVTVVLKDGQTLKGKFVNANSEKLSVIIGSSAQEMNMSEVASLVFFETTRPSASTSVEIGSISASHDAIKALRKLESATSVGVSFVEYGRRLIDAKVSVDDSLPRIPDNELKSEIEMAMGEYSFASQVWQQIIDGRIYRHTRPISWPDGTVSPRDELGEILMQKYKLKPDDGAGEIILRPNVLSVIWQVGKEHLDKAARLAG